MLQDVLGKPVNSGDEVVLLVKERCYRGISDAYLGHAIYAGKGPWGHEFIDYKDREEKDPKVYRVREPDCVRIDREEGIPYVQA